MKRKLWISLALLTILGLPAKALAHAVETNYILKDAALELTAVYSTGEPMKNANVKIYAPGNTSEPLMEAKTDENGRFLFSPDREMPGEWEVSISQEGHGDILTVPVSQKGVELEDISAIPQISPQLLIIGALCVSGGFGSALLFAKRRT